MNVCRLLQQLWLFADVVPQPLCRFLLGGSVLLAWV